MIPTTLRVSAPRLLRGPGIFGLLACLSFTTATAGLAQQPVGATNRTSASVPSRGGLNALPGTLFTRFDHDDLRGFGMTTPGTHVITGVVVSLADYDGSTPETFSVELYSEDPGMPGFPLLGSPLVSVGPFASPPAGPGRAPFTSTVPFAPAVNVPSGKDLFVGIVLQGAPTWPADGLAVDCVLGHSSRWTVYDATGPAAIQNGSYASMLFSGSGSATYNTARQLVIDLLTPTPGGGSTAVTNQLNYVISNSPPGSGGFLSALHPDARATPLHPGRADDVGFEFLDQATPDGSLVLFFADFTGFGPELSLQTLAPGSRGVACLPLATMESMGTSVVAAGRSSITLPIPAPVRVVLAGVPMVMQAVALDIGAGILNASPCTRRVF
jgi:hypothetical protein